MVVLPLLVLSVFMPFWAAKIWVEGTGGEYTFNAAAALLIPLVVSIPATVLLGVMLVRHVKLVLRGPVCFGGGGQEAEGMAF